MLITTRSQAITDQLFRYYTGIPCKRGHLSQRYTNTGACISCLNPKIPNTLLAVRGEAKAKMKIFKVALDVCDREQYTKIVHTYAQLREPKLYESDVCPRFDPRGVDGGRWVYSFRAFPADVPYLIRIARDFNWERMSPQEQTTLLLNPQADYVPPPLRAPGQ